MRGRWAAGIVPRNFAWIIKDQLAVSERPGGYAPHHRKVRRHEEILWLSVQGFTRVVSLLPSSHNLHAYDELGLASAHFALPAHADVKEVLEELYPALLEWLRHGERLLIHQEELGERVAGVIAGFLCWSGVLPEPPQAISAVEQLLRRQMGSAGRSIVAVAAEIVPQNRPDAPTVLGTIGVQEEQAESPAATGAHGSAAKPTRSSAPTRQDDRPKVAQPEKKAASRARKALVVEPSPKARAAKAKEKA